MDNGIIKAAFNVLQDDLWDKVTAFLIHSNCRVALEDIRPYSLRLTPQVLDTTRFVGEASHRLRMVCGKKFSLITRSEVKKWVFDSFPGVCIPRIEHKMKKKGRVNKDGTSRKPSFNYVDDQIVKVAMREMYALSRKKKGELAPLGVEDHAFQALALASFVNSFN